MKRRQFLTQAVSTMAVAPFTSLRSLPPALKAGEVASHSIRAAQLHQWEQVLDQAAIDLENLWAIVFDARMRTPAEVDAERLYDLIWQAKDAMDSLCSRMESAEFEDFFEVMTGRKSFVITIERALGQPDCDLERLATEIEAMGRQDHPAEVARLRELLEERIAKGSIVL
ncbi:MAG: hypothetical protein FOGNACKC_02226 [Anaerolineae bacterium]|nr:hypothetical protein [Anaerolineae bacterium]